MHQQKILPWIFLSMKYFVEKFPNYSIRILLIWHWLAKYHQSAVIHLNLTIITANVLIWRLKWSSIEAFPKILLDTIVFILLYYWCFVKFYLLFIYLHIQPLIVVFIFSQVLPHLYTHTYKHWLWVFILFAFLSFIYHLYIHTYNHWLWL